jgi:hypothetical protein
MKKLKHILLEQGILGQNIDIQTGKPFATPGREFAPMLFDPKTAAKQLVAVKSHPKRTIPAEIKNIILALPDANAYNAVLTEFKRLLGGMTLPEFIINYGLPTDTNGAVSFLNDITRHLTKIKTSTVLISPYTIKLKELTTESGVALRVVEMMTKASSGGGTDEQGILAALMLIKNITIYNDVLTLIKKQPISDFAVADIEGMNDPIWNQLSGRRWNTVMQWIQIKEFTPLMSGDTLWLSKYSKILKKFNPNEVVGTRPKGDASNTNPASVAGDGIGFGDSTAWDDPEFRHNVQTVASIASAFFGPWGLALSTVMQLVDSKQYFEEGKDYEGGLALTFALLPGIGKLVGPTMKPFLKKLIAKIVTKSGNFTKLEREVLIRAEMSKDIIRNKLNTIIKDGIESGIINPMALPTLKFVKSVGNGIYRLTTGAVKHAIVPMVAYDAAYAKLNPPISLSELNSLMYTELKSNITSRLKNIK